MALTYPDLDEFDYEKYRDGSTVEELAREGTSVVLAISGIYEHVVWGHFGLRSCGDINGEWVGRRIAEQVAKDYLEDTDGVTDVPDEAVVVTKVNTTDELMPDHEDYHYHVAIVV